MAAKWTESQQDAIRARRGTVLVSAAAGSGKTAVLVERVIERICDPVSPTDADRLLIVTFTKAAAAEMKERIASRLSAMLEETPNNQNLRRQQVLLRRANISTIHSFCSRMVKQNFYKLGISPEYYVAEESEMELFRGQAINDVMTAAYEKNTPEFQKLLETFGSDRDDKKLMDTILQVYHFTCSNPFPEQWMKETAALYREDKPIEQTVWGKVLVDYIASAISNCISLTESAIALLDTDEKLCKAYLPALESDLAMLRNLQSLCEHASWDDLMLGLENRVFVRFSAVRGYKDDPLAEQVKALRQQVKDTIDKKILPRTFTSAECRYDLERQAPLVDTLFQMVSDFTKRLDEIKAEKKAADFNDLERWMLQLLFEERNGTYIRTEDADKIADLFDEIIVDEYQDTNEAQDRIFRAISKNETNLFLVGDVKQSIYGFRQAMPQLFMNRRNAYPEYDREKDQYPACVILDRNFRSRETVTRTVNFIFRLLMTEQSAGIDYNDKETLKVGAQYDPQDGVETELEIIHADAVHDETIDEDMAILEARQIAGRIAEMIADGFLVTDHGVKRPITYGDFVILLRNANNHMGKYVRELQMNGIPSRAGKQPGFFKTAETAVMVSFLRVISNPMQDIPLVSVLMSPIYGFTPDDLAEIRSADQKKSLYLALQQAAENGMEKAIRFLQDLDEYRILAATLPSDKMLNQIYNRTGYCDLVQAMSNGERRVANLQLLLEYAHKFEKAGYNGVAGFVRFVDQLQRYNGDLSRSEIAQEEENVVQIMSIHNSKGLEFPVCFVAGCSRRLNRLRDNVLLHPKLGLGVKLGVGDTLCKYTTLMREAIAIASDQEEVAEDMRIFYVALTRAREKLILVMTEKKLESKLNALAAGLSTGTPDPYSICNAASFSDWILTCALYHPDGDELRKNCGVDVPICRCNDYTPWNIRLLLPCYSWEKEIEEVQKPPVDPVLLEKIQQRISYAYPYAPLLDLPAKVTASALAEETAARKTELPQSLPRPSFLYQKGLTPAERGTATHIFMQFCNFELAKQEPQAELDRLMLHGFLTKEQGKAVDFRKVAAFFKSSAGRRMERSLDVRREYRFTAEIPARFVQEDLDGVFAEQKIVLQGAVDCVFEEDGELVIVDYKTDVIKDPQQLWDRYEKQLDLYAMAMEQCTGMKVKETMLYSFYLDAVVKKEGIDGKK